MAEALLRLYMYRQATVNNLKVNRDKAVLEPLLGQ